MNVVCRDLRRIVFVIGMLIGSAAPVWAAPTPAADQASAAAQASEFRWSRAVRLPDNEKPALAAISLDSAIFAATRDDLADLSLRDGNGRAVAFVRRQPPTTKTHSVLVTSAAVQRGAKPVAPNGLEILFDLPERYAGTPGGISIETPLRNFEQHVRVDASSDGEVWRPVSEPTLIFDYSQLVDVRNVNVPIAPTTDRHFRLRIEDVTAQEQAQLVEMSRHFQGGQETDRTDRTQINRRPLRVDRIKFYQNVLEVEKTGIHTIAYPTTGFSTHEDAERGQTVLEFDCQRAPLSLLRVQTDETNFRRQATLEVATEVRGQQKWRTVATATLSRLSLEGVEKSALTIDVPQQRGERYRVLIENQDSPPVVFRGVEMFGPEYQLVFLATPGQSLTLEYGWPRAKMPSYDVAAINAVLAAGRSPLPAELEGPAENQPVANAGRWSELVADTPLLVGVIAVLSVLLGWGIYRAAARIDASPPV